MINAMVQKRLTIDYQEYASMAEMEEADRSLLEDGTVVTGANQENAAFPSGLCAERTALFAAHAQYPHLAVRAIAITACRGGRMVPEPAWPCGACRQVLAESQKRAEAPVRVIVGGLCRIVVFSCVEDILPFIFNGL